MRTVIILAALATVAGTAAGQTRVTTQRRVTDTVRVIDARLLSPAEVRAIAAEIRAATERLGRIEKQIVRDRREQGDGEWKWTPNPDVMRLLSEIISKQGRLSVACATLRPVPGQSDGVLGIEISEIVMNEVRAGVDTAVERFARPPVIAMVKPNSPAAQAGLRVGDEWLAIERRDLVGASVGDVMALVKPGARVEIRVRRDGKDLVDVPVTVVKRPEFPADACEHDGTPFFQMAIPGLPDDRRFRIEQVTPGSAPRMPSTSIFFMPGAGKAVLYGATFRVLTDDARKAIKVQGDGVLVDEVSPGSQADEAGLRAFDVVTRANGEDVKSLKDLFRISSGSDGLVLSVVSGGTTRIVKVVSR